MELGRLLTLALALVASTPVKARTEIAAEAAVTPIQKVLVMMDDMLAQGIQAKNEEATRFSAFSQWCADQKRIKSGEVKVGEERMEQLNAQIMKLEANIRELTDRILELEEDVSRWQRDQKAATEVRGKENTDYQATVMDYSESVDAVSEALEVLKKQAYNRPQAELVQALLQVQHRRMVPPATRSALTVFLQQAQPSVEAMPDDKLFYEAPEAYSYEFQSGGVVDMLAKLKSQFSTQKRDLMADEVKAKHAYEVMMQVLTDNIENAEHEISKRTKLRAEAEQAKAEAEGDLAETTKERDEDQKYLDETTAMCHQKSEDFESRQALRADEIATLKQAIEIISSETVQGAGEKHLPAMLQTAARTGRSLAQARSDQESPVKARIASFLAERARLTGSPLLADVSQRVADNPFKKVKKLIKDLIVQLMEEATAETEHKGWCDTELTTNKQTREARTADVSSLTAEVDELEAAIAQLTEDVKVLAAGIEELDKAMAEATTEREASKAKNLQTIDEAKQAETAVEQALALLKDFYARSAEATALAQQTPAEDAPETFDKPYKGMGAEGGNILSFLDVILTDFTRLESETANAEAQEEDTYKQFMFESEKDKATKQNMSKLKAATKVDKEGELHTAEEELKSAQEQLGAATDYYNKLKPTCVDSGISYEERVKRREEEIQSLQEALKILSGENLA